MKFWINVLWRKSLVCYTGWNCLGFFQQTFIFLASITVFCDVCILLSWRLLHMLFTFRTRRGNFMCTKLFPVKQSKKNYRNSLVCHGLQPNYHDKTWLFMRLSKSNWDLFIFPLQRRTVLVRTTTSCVGPTPRQENWCHNPVQTGSADSASEVNYNEAFPLTDLGGAPGVRPPKGPNSFVLTYKFYET